MSDKTPRCSYEEFRAKLLQNPEVRKEYEHLEPQYELARRRIEAGLSQKELAKLSGTTQAAISDFLTGKRDMRLSGVQRVARALGYRLCLEKLPSGPVAE